MDKTGVCKQDRGMVTVELAIGFVAAGVVAAMLAWAVGLVSLQSRCFDTATIIARSMSRGDRSAASKAASVGPKGAHWDVRSAGKAVSVRVWVDVDVLGVTSIRLEGEATYPKEP